MDVFFSEHIPKTSWVVVAVASLELSLMRLCESLEGPAGNKNKPLSINTVQKNIIDVSTRCVVVVTCIDKWHATRHLQCSACFHSDVLLKSTAVRQLKAP